jgi:hypothetical protein
MRKRDMPADRVPGNVSFPDADAPQILPFPSDEVRCHQRLGDLLKHYYRAAA